MAKVVVKNDSVTIEVPDGALLADIDGKCSVLFACKSGTCGSCLVKVVEGMEHLEAPDDIESVGLQAFGSDPTHRLMCQAKIKKGQITIEY